jgi:hypothetical protein
MVADPDSVIRIHPHRQAGLLPVHRLALFAAFRAGGLVFAKALLPQRDALGVQIVPQAHRQPPLAACGT